jgi:hypothetical protein
MLGRLLAILRVQGEWFMTVPDLAVWLYGDSSRADRLATHNHLVRLRKLGYGLEQRSATWTLGRGGPKGYRLVSEPSSRTEEAA